MECHDNQCTIDSQNIAPTPITTGDDAIVYVGDPMCSWCWGFAPALQALREAGAKRGLPFEIVLGGLRAGGADEWTAEFRQFLRHHWQEVAQRSHQPFSFDLLDRPQFAYDTEPACRAVVALRQILAKNHRLPELYDCFHTIQARFYVDNQDPSELVFYESICTKHHVDFDEFSNLFQQDAIKKATIADFALCRRWQVRAFPTVLLRQNGQMRVLSAGFCPTPQLLNALSAQWRA